MQEKTLLRISLVAAIAGVGFLFIISQIVSPVEGDLMEANKNYIIHGTIGRINQLDKVTFINLEKEDEITVVLFKKYPVDLHEGDYVEVKGKAEESGGELEFIGKEIRVIK